MRRALTTSTPLEGRIAKRVLLMRTIHSLPLMRTRASRMSMLKSAKVSSNSLILQSESIDHDECPRPALFPNPSHPPGDLGQGCFSREISNQYGKWTTKWLMVGKSQTEACEYDAADAGTGVTFTCTMKLSGENDVELVATYTCLKTENTEKLDNIAVSLKIIMLQKYEAPSSCQTIRRAELALDRNLM